MLEIKVVIILLNEDFTRIDHTHTLLALSLPFSLSLSLSLSFYHSFYLYSLSLWADNVRQRLLLLP